MGGIVNKVWNIQGSSMFKGASSQITDSIEYILNDEKTEQNVSMKGSIINDINAQLERECQYAANDVKTMQGALIGTHNLISSDINGAVKEMMDVKKFYEKLDGRAALHGIISLPVEESDVSNASRLLKLCEEVMKEVFPDNQSVFAIHTNTENLHVHFIVNSVGLDGKKIHQDKNFVKKVLHPTVNKYAEKYGFTMNDEWTKKKDDKQNKSSYAELKSGMRKIVDQAIEESNNFDEFVELLRLAGVTVNIGKYISLKTSDMRKAIRTHQLGGNYTKDAIVERIATRMDAFENLNFSTSDHSYKHEKNDVFLSHTSILKKYKDLPETEKQRVVKELKKGRNPWQLQQKMNWQLNEISKKINTLSHVVELKKFYSVDGTLQGALDGILDIKKEINEEKKRVKNIRKKYKPIIDIYEEMKPLAKKAYLYEHEGIEEYRVEFEKYRLLSRRLKEGYGKNVIEVRDFLDECDERIMYANAQLGKLSDDYREIKKYGLEHGILHQNKDSLYDFLEVKKSIESSRRNVFEGDLFYVVSKQSNVMLRVLKTPYVDENGKKYELFELSVIDASGKVIENFNNKKGNKIFYEQLSQIEKKYNFKDCKKFQEVLLAREYLSAKNMNDMPDTKQKSNDDKLSPTILNEKKTYSFTQAINLNSVKKNNGVHFIVNSRNPEYFAMIMTNENMISIRVINDTDILEEVTIPSLKNKKINGFDRLTYVQKKYGFSDELFSYENMEDVRNYVEDQEKKKHESKNNDMRR